METLHELPKIDLSDNETGCCPRFHREIYDDKLIELEGLLMVKAISRKFLHIPLNIGAVMTRTMAKIRKADAEVKDNYLILSKDISNWKSEHYFLVSKPVEGLENVSLSGSYLTKVYEGEFYKMPDWIKEMETYAKDKGFAIEDLS